MMTNETEFFLSQDGLKLHYRYWLPKDAENVICIVHGLGEHSGRYVHVGDYLYKKKSAVFALDIRGHGKSGGKKGHTKSYAHLLNDIEELLKTARAEYTDLPLFLMGHSMGGNLVANYLIKMNTNDIAGFILSSPWLKLAFAPPGWKLRLGKVAAKVLPGLRQPNGLIASFLSKDEDVVKAYQEDPNVHSKISAGLFEYITRAGSYALDHADEISTMGLVYHGNADKIIDHKSSELFAARCKHASWHELENVYHEPHNDLENANVLQMIADWIHSKTQDFNPDLAI